jgi:hypothetical protein
MRFGSDAGKHAFKPFPEGFTNSGSGDWQEAL